MYFINQYGLIILVVILAILYGILLYKKYKGMPKAEIISGLEKDAFELMQQAEKFLPNEKGYVKFDWVAKRFINFIPPIAKYLFKEQTVEHFLQQSYYKFKDKLDNGKVDKSIEYPPESIEQSDTNTEELEDEDQEESSTIVTDTGPGQNQSPLI